MMIKLDQISFGYANQLILNTLDLTISDNEILGIVGESGSGKTTLAQLLFGMKSPVSGTLTSTFDSVLPIFQHAYDSFNPKLKIEVSLEEPIRYYIKDERAGVRKRMFQLMEDMNLPQSLLAKYPDEVSGGQLQRFNVIRTLMLQPDMIVCDEITSSLDVVAQGRMLSILKHYYETNHHAMVIISHDMAALSQLVQRFIVMKNGEIVDDFPKQDIFSSSRHPYTKKLLRLYLE